MRIGSIKETLGAVMLTGMPDLEADIGRAYCADLMSDVLSFSVTNSLLITHLTNAQVIRTAEVAEIRAIVFVEGKRPDLETISIAERKKIPLLVTDLAMFDACGKLYEKGFRSDHDCIST